MGGIAPNTSHSNGLRSHRPVWSGVNGVECRGGNALNRGEGASGRRQPLQRPLHLPELSHVRGIANDVLQPGAALGGLHALLR